MNVRERTHKKCGRCRVTLPVASFHRNRSTPDGRSGYCESCDRAAMASWRAAHPENDQARNVARKRGPFRCVCRRCHVEFLAGHPAASRCPIHHDTPGANRVGRVVKHQAMYRGPWQHKIRPAVMREEPTCRSCGVPSEQVDHITPIEDGGTHDRANLQALCGPCHRRKTRADIASRLKTRGARP